MRPRRVLAGVAAALWFAGKIPAEEASRTAAGQSLAVATVSTAAEALLRGGPAAWSPIPARRVALNRTPPLYDTDEPAGLEISEVDVRLARSGGRLMVSLAWRDPTRDAVALAAPPGTPPETRFVKVPTEADDRFFDAAAVMVPSKTGGGALSPSLQMGDAGHPVRIYYWNATRGATVMQAEGRGTTHRTGDSFPALGTWQDGLWFVTMELPDAPAGTTVAFAVWNGSQKDRDGRKYFSVWQVLE
jgi:hypothetical protein